MEFKTKFNFGEKVHQIWLDQKKQWVDCEFCSGSGVIVGSNDEERGCPVCYSRRGAYKVIGNEHSIQKVLTIGEIRVEARCDYTPGYDYVFDNYGPQEAYQKESYMCYESGIGSGTIWPADKLFHTEEEAQAECDRLNSAI